MRVVSVILLGIAGFCLYLAASASLMGIWAAILGRTLSAFAFLTTIGWIMFALFFGLGVACSRQDRRATAAAVTILVGLLGALSAWMTIGLMLLSPTFVAVLPPGHDYRSAAPAALAGGAVLLVLTVPIGLWLQRIGRCGPASDGVTGLPQ